MLYRTSDYPQRTPATDKPGTTRTGAVLWLILCGFMFAVLAVLIGLV